MEVEEKTDDIDCLLENWNRLTFTRSEFVDTGYLFIETFR